MDHSHHSNNNNAPASTINSPVDNHSPTIELDITTKEKEYIPFIIHLDIYSAANIPVADFKSSDPFVVIFVGDRQVNETKVKDSTLNPKWNQKFEIPLIHLKSNIILRLLDHNKLLKHKLMGKVEIKLDEIIRQEAIQRTVPWTTEAGGMPASGTITYGIRVEANENLFSVRHKHTSSQTQLQVTNKANDDLKIDFEKYQVPITVQQLLKKSRLVSDSHLDSFTVRDMLIDVACLSKPTNGHPMKLRIEDARMLCGTQIDLNKNSYSRNPPDVQQKTIYLYTHTNMYTLGAASEFAMWAWVREIRRYASRYRLLHDKNNINQILLMDQTQFFQSEDIKNALSFSGHLKVFHEGKYWKSKCMLKALTLELRCELEEGQTIVLDLKTLDKIIVTNDFEKWYPNYLSLNLTCATIISVESRDVDDDQTNPNDTSSNEQKTKSDSSWTPGKYLFKGAKFGAKIVLGTAENALSITTSTVGNVVSAAAGVRDGVVNVVQGGASIATGGNWNVNQKSYIVINSHGIRDNQTTPLPGNNPYWNHEVQIVMTDENLTKGYFEKRGVYVFLFSGTEGSEQIVGEKFVPYSELISSNAIADSKASITNSSHIRELSIPLDGELVVNIHIIKGVNLLAPPANVSTVSNFAGLSTIYAPSTEYDINDRHPRIKMSFVKWMGSDRGEKYRTQKTRAIKKSINPEWNEKFEFRSVDGLWWAKFIRLEITDRSRTGPDSLMGTVYIPIDDLELSQGNLIKEYKIVPSSAGMSKEETNLGSLFIGTYLSYSSKVYSNIGPPIITMTSQIKSINEMTTMFLCESTSLEYVQSIEETDLARQKFEKYLIAPGFDFLYLEDYVINKQDDLSSVNMMYQQFQRRTRDGEKEIIEFRIFENERRSLIPPNDFGTQLLPQDPNHFSDETGTIRCPYSPYELTENPPDADGFKWDGPWKVDKNYTFTDEEGWSYGVDFGWIMSNYRKGTSSTSSLGRAVRRRCWVRKAYKLSQSEVVKEVEDSFRDIMKKGKSLTKRDIVKESKSNEDNVVEVHIFENQRRRIMFPHEFGPGNQFYGERADFSDETGSISAPYTNLDDASPPPGYIWEPGSTWKFDKTYTQTDDLGWCYGVDYSYIMTNYRKKKSTTNPIGRSVRRRKWVRKIIPDPSSSFILDEASSNRDSIDLAAATNVVTRSEVFKNDQISFLKLCEERMDLKSSIRIPWEQVLSIDVITESVLSITITIHRYFGDHDGEPIYREAQTELFVLACPASYLFQLMKERIAVMKYRKKCVKLMATRSMTGEVGNDGLYHPNLVNDNEIHAQELSLGSQTILDLDLKVTSQEEQVEMLSKLSINLNQWLLQGCIHSLERVTLRLKCYIAALLGAGLSGPSYEEEDVRAMLLHDVNSAQNFFAAANEEDKVDSARDMVSFLLDTAEMRIRDYCLCGWSHQGGVLENCLRIIINQYYIQIISVLGIYFDNKHGLNTLVGHEQKLKLIVFFLEKNEHLSTIVTSSLKPYEFEFAPLPLLSLSLNIETLLQWYGKGLSIEMIKYAENAVKANRITEHANDIVIPWNIEQVNKFYSNIPNDLKSLLENYLQMFRIQSSLMENMSTNYLDQNIKLGYIGSFSSLAEYYKQELIGRDWILLHDTKADIVDDQVIPWLCSIANDCHAIRTTYLNACLEAYDANYVKQGNSRSPRRQSVSMNTEGLELVNTEMSKLLKSLTSIIDTAVDTISCILFKSLGTKLPLVKIYTTWRKGDSGSPDLVVTVLQKLDENLGAFASGLEYRCLCRLLDICLTKMSIWYLQMLKEFSADYHAKLTNVDCQQIKSDCNEIKIFFESYLNENNPESEASEKNSRLGQGLLTLDRVSIIMSAAVGSAEYTKAVFEYIDDAKDCNYKAFTYIKMLKSLFNIRDNQQVDEDGDELMNSSSLQDKVFQSLQDIASTYRNTSIVPFGAEFYVFGLKQSTFSFGNAGNSFLEGMLFTLQDKSKHQPHVDEVKDTKGILASVTSTVTSTVSSVTSSTVSAVTTALPNRRKSTVTSSPIDVSSHTSPQPHPVTHSNSDTLSTGFSKMFNHIGFHSAGIKLHLSEVTLTNLFKTKDSKPKFDVFIEFSAHGSKTKSKTIPFEPHLQWMNDTPVLSIPKLDEELLILKCEVYYKEGFIKSTKLGGCCIVCTDCLSVSEPKELASEIVLDERIDPPPDHASLDLQVMLHAKLLVERVVKK